MKIQLKKVRLSFPNLAKPKSIAGSEPKYGASFLLDKAADAAQIDMLRKACMDVAKEKWPAKIPAGVKYCVHDGAEKDYVGYGPAIMYISATNAMPVPIVDEFVQPMDPHKAYAGGYVNVVIRLWAQDNDYGKRVNAQLQTIQWAGDGESFGDKPVNPEDEFQPLKAPDGEPAPTHGGQDAGMADDSIPF